MSGRPRIAFVSREVAPFGGGGIGTYVRATAQALAPVADVTVFTTDLHRAAHEGLVRDGDPGISGLEIRFVPEPGEVNEPETHHQVWSANAFEALVDAYPDGGPDLAEFPDYLGEGFVTAQARRTGDPRLANTTVCVRLYTTAEMTGVLDGCVGDAFAERLTFELERYALAQCDHVLWPGGDVLGTYQRRFGAEAIASPVHVRHVLDIPTAPPATIPDAPDEPFTRLLYLGRLERRKGVLNLARALGGIPQTDFSLTFAGGDTDTAPLGQSMRAMLDLMLSGDPRVTFLDQLPRTEVAELIDAHDLVVMPSLWECWPAVGLEALQRNRPLLTSATGGFTEMVQEGRSGWKVAEAGPGALAEALERVLGGPDRTRELIDSQEPRRVFEELTEADPVREQYLQLAARPPERRRPIARSGRPLVSVVIPYFRLDRFIEMTVESVFAQTHPRVELLIVNDGSLRDEDRVLARLAERFPLRVLTQTNAGLGAARNAGVRHSRGSYVVFLDADNVLDPRFIARCADVLESSSDLSYVTAWSRYVDDRGEPLYGSGIGYRPLGNWSRLIDAKHNTVGDAAAMFRRSLFIRDGLWFSEELTSFEDWAYYQLLSRNGHIGDVICEQLLDYRVRWDSMVREVGVPNWERLDGEMRAYLMEAEAEWISPSV
jgi:glycosyltransferase involved in cell wall biosynthesis